MAPAHLQSCQAEKWGQGWLWVGRTEGIKKGSWTTWTETEFIVLGKLRGVEFQGRLPGERKLHREEVIFVCRGFSWSLQLSTVETCVKRLLRPGEGSMKGWFVSSSARVNELSTALLKSKLTERTECIWVKKRESQSFQISNRELEVGKKTRLSKIWERKDIYNKIKKNKQTPEIVPIGISNWSHLIY